MTYKNLESLFNPQRIAVIEANEDEKSAGFHVLKNLIGKGFRGIVYPVNSSMDGVQGIEAYKTVGDIPHRIDLALITCDYEKIPSTLEDCGRNGVKGICILPQDLWAGDKSHSRIYQKIHEISNLYGCRVLGPNSYGFLRPSLNLNASLSSRTPETGHIAFVSESGIFSTTFLDHAINRKVGFSYFISLGEKCDINIADTVDFLAGDTRTRAIFLFLKTITDGRRFMTAIRNYAKKNPIMIVKPGMADPFSSLSVINPGPDIDEDMIYDAMFRRAGCLRVNSIIDLLYMVETIAKQKRPKGKRMMIISNSRAPSEMALGYLKTMGGELAQPTVPMLTALGEGATSERGLDNPLNLPPEASAEEYRIAIQKSIQDPVVDGILAICIPFPGINIEKISDAIATEANKRPQVPVFMTWFGKEGIPGQMRTSSNHRIPTYFTAEHAVKSFMYMYRYDSNLKLLQETPEILIKNFSPGPDIGKEIITQYMKQKQYSLRVEDATQILRSYGVSVLDTHRVADQEEAVNKARNIGYPVVLKLYSTLRTFTNQEEMVFIQLQNNQEVRDAFNHIQQQSVAINSLDTSIILQPMTRKPGYKIMIGAEKTKSFGTIIKFGLGGKNLRAQHDYAIGFPPLNQTLARRLIEETKICCSLRDHYSARKSNIRILEEVLVRFSQLVVDLPQIKKVELNPLILMGDQCIIRDLTIHLDKDLPGDYTWSTGNLCPQHLSIPPYPFKLATNVTLKSNKTIHIRPIRSEDEPALYRFFEGLSRESFFLRFGQHSRNIPHNLLVRLCQVDYDRDLAFLAFTDKDEDTIIGDVRLNRFMNLNIAELSFIVTDEWQGKGIGGALMEYCIEVGRNIGLKTLLMEIMKNNEPMIQLAYKYNFRRLPNNGEEDLDEFQLDLTSQALDGKMGESLQSVRL